MTSLGLPVYSTGHSSTLQEVLELIAHHVTLHYADGTIERFYSDVVNTSNECLYYSQFKNDDDDDFIGNYRFDELNVEDNRYEHIDDVVQSQTKLYYRFNYHITLTGGMERRYMISPYVPLYGEPQVNWDTLQSLMNWGNQLHREGRLSRVKLVMYR